MFHVKHRAVGLENAILQNNPMDQKIGFVFQCGNPVHFRHVRGPSATGFGHDFDGLRAGSAEILTRRR